VIFSKASLGEQLKNPPYVISFSWVILSNLARQQKVEIYHVARNPEVESRGTWAARTE
jgi:hypothetical protein